MAIIQVPVPDQVRDAIRDHARKAGFPSTAAAIRFAIGQWMGQPIESNTVGRPFNRDEHLRNMGAEKQPDGSYRLPGGETITFNNLKK